MAYSLRGVKGPWLRRLLPDLPGGVGWFLSPLLFCKIVAVGLSYHPAMGNAGAIGVKIIFTENRVDISNS